MLTHLYDLCKQKPLFISVLFKGDFKIICFMCLVTRLEKHTLEHKICEHSMAPHE
jgi:hypothetical protein